MCRVRPEVALGWERDALPFMCSAWGTDVGFLFAGTVRVDA
jgi:hypothetical protein